VNLPICDIGTFEPTAEKQFADIIPFARD